MHWGDGCGGRGYKPEDTKGVIQFQTREDKVWEEYQDLNVKKEELEILRGLYLSSVEFLGEILKKGDDETITKKIIPYLIKKPKEILPKIKGLRRKIKELEKDYPDLLCSTGGGNYYNTPECKYGDKK